MSDEHIGANNEETGSGDQKKKQKAGLGAIRPGDYTERRFKEMAEEKGWSQTKLFEVIFWDYLTDEKGENRQNALNLEGEINLISADLGNLMKHFEAIVSKAQDTIISIKSNAETTEANLNRDIDTLNKKIKELQARNAELEQSNGIFNEVKAGLDARISEFDEINKKKDAEITELKGNIKEKDSKIRQLEDTVESMKKDENKSQNEIGRLAKELSDKAERIKNIEAALRESTEDVKELEKKNHTLENEKLKVEQEVRSLSEELRTKDISIGRLESSNSNFANTVNNMETLKRAEITAIEARYQLMITELETKLSTIEENKTREIDATRQNLKTEFEADKRMALADVRLELADMKNKYVETLSELNTLKQQTGK